MPQSYQLKSSLLVPDKMEILIVDDDQMIRFLHQSLLDLCKVEHSVRAFSNGKEALDYLEQQESDLQFLVLLDINMPVMDGWDFLMEHGKKKLENCFVVLITSSVNQSDRERAFYFPQVIDYRIKPFFKSSLLEVTALEPLLPFFQKSEVLLEE